MTGHATPTDNRAVRGPRTSQSDEAVTPAARSGRRESRRSEAAQVLALQRRAGNQAVAGLIGAGGLPVVARAGEETAAEQLRDAIEGWGTDEATVFRVLGAHRGSVALRNAYRRLTGRSLEADLRDDLSGAELDRALRLYFGYSSAVWDAAVRLKNAMGGLGTDEDTVFEVLRAQATASARETLRNAYHDVTGRSLLGDIRGDFSGDELREAVLAYEMGPLTPDLTDALALRDAMSGLGTDEAEVFRVLRQRTSPGALDPLKAAYERLTGRTLEADIRADFSGDELTEALRLLGMGTFTNEITQDMFEGTVTVVRGRFEWRFEAGALKVDVRANFVPAEGVTVPLATWQSQIDGVWNQYALTEPGGEHIPIEFSLLNDTGGKRIDVVQNSTPGTYGPPDRANAGKWYPVMRPSTAPHEYGHLIGLPDEYQRTHDDFEEITGRAAPVGPTNTSGQTNAEIAEDLHDALTDSDEAQRAPLATTVLENVGLIVGGAPQQGDFAQEVMAAYDGAYTPNLEDTLAALPRGTKWTLQSVFSYASGTIMGNPGVVPHEHPVAPRHLREFVAIANDRFPGFAWTTGPR